jgi:hypothetical protein
LVSYKGNAGRFRYFVTKKDIFSKENILGQIADIDVLVPNFSFIPQELLELDNVICVRTPEQKPMPDGWIWSVKWLRIL